MREAVPEVPCALPIHTSITGKHVKLHPMQAEHADLLFNTLGGEENGQLYNYMFYGPFVEKAPFREHIRRFAAGVDPQFYTIEDLKTGNMVGQISFLRIEPTHRIIEIGHIIFGPQLKRTIGATEAWYLLARKAFEEGYRRLEWKCDNDNRASFRSATRFGHTFEGVFRQHMIVKGYNRDSAWFSILDSEWPARKEAIERWMSADNFDESGMQKRDLAALQAEVAEGNATASTAN